jgi:hypothetical protein
MATKTKQALDDRGLIRWQMLLGAGLIAFGALSIPLFQVSGVLDGQTATAAFAVATGVIGAGAAMLPTGAAAGASARILRSVPDQSDGADDPRSSPSGQPDMNLAVANTEVSNGQAGTPAQGAGDMPRTLRQLWADEDEASPSAPTSSGSST